MSKVAAAKKLSPVERFLSLFAEMEAGEGLACILNFCNIFLILASYYILKVVRDGLIVGGKKWFGLSGAEVKIYAAAAMAILLLGVVPLYGYVASKVSRIKLINSCYAVVMGFLGLFFVLGKAGVNLGLAFFLWLGIVNVFLISQFWQYANDIYSKKQGERLFAIIAIGGSLGAILGPLIAKLYDGVYVLMIGAAAGLGVCLLLFNTVNKLEAERVQERKAAAKKDEAAKKDSAKAGAQDAGDKPLGKEGGFQLIFKQNYLLFIGLMVLVANLVNTTGEYILGNAAETHAAQVAPVPADVQAKLDALPKAPGTSDYTEAAEEQADLLMKPINKKRAVAAKSFFAEFFLWVNIAVFIIQSFFVSRIFKRFGVRAALFVLPVIALGGYACIGLLGGLAVLRVAKTAENATDYSLQNTIKQALFLPTSREAKYKAKAAIDTFFVRTGDALSAALVAVGLHQLGFTAKSFALTNVVFVLVWLALNVGISRGHKALSKAAGEETDEAEGAEAAT